MWKRLKGKQQIAHLFKKGKRFSANRLSLVYLKEAEHPSVCAFSVGVPKRCIPKAVERNRIKRQLRAAVYAFLKAPDTSIPKGVFMVFFYGKSLEKSTIIHSNVHQLLRRYCKVE